MNRSGTRLCENLEASIAAKRALIADASTINEFERVVAVMVAAYKNGGRIYIAGNGGSAADAQHLATEFVSKLSRPRAPLPAEALTVDSSTLTAIGNDYGFDEVFARQIEGKLTARDVFLAITTSGKSPNIIRALETCQELGITSVVLTGRDGGDVKKLANHCLIAPGKETSEIQEVHMVLYHTLCGCVEDAMFADNEVTAPQWRDRIPQMTQ